MTQMSDVLWLSCAVLCCSVLSPAVLCYANERFPCISKIPCLLRKQLCTKPAEHLTLGTSTAPTEHPDSGFILHNSCNAVRSASLCISSGSDSWTVVCCCGRPHEGMWQLGYLLSASLPSKSLHVCPKRIRQGLLQSPIVSPLSSISAHPDLVNNVIATDPILGH